MCFAWLKKGKHISKDCKNKLVCKECEKRHPNQEKSDNASAKRDDAKKKKKKKKEGVKTVCARTGAAQWARMKSKLAKNINQN